ncbi:STS14 protein-like [Nicotiana sylvestris]|uniref:STS14 protein-like n=1 Tax=Nicotiana sylvestris TaxID=4096 RepID=UPI00388C4CB3
MTKLFLLALLFQSLIAVSEHHGSGQSVAPPIAGGTTPAAPSSAAQEFLDAHNKARAEVGVGPLKWSTMLANATSIITRYQRDKRNCSFANLSSINYGQLQLLFRGLVAIPPQVAVDIWVAEKKFYNYANNSCIQGHECFSYTQVVWKNSLELGCAQATCSNNHYSNHTFL